MPEHDPDRPQLPPDARSPVPVQYHFHVGAIDVHAHMSSSGGDSGRQRNSEDDRKNESSDDGGDQEDKDDAKGGKDKDDDQKADEKKKPHSKLPIIILVIVVVIAAIVALIFWLARRDEERTDDAFTDGNAVTMAPKISGYVVQLNVDDNTFVRKGDLLLKIEPRDFLAAQLQAKGQLDDAKAQLEAARANYAIAKVQYPAQLASARAQERAAAATLKQSQASFKRQHEVDPRATTAENIDQADSQTSQSASNLANAKSQTAVAALVPEQLRQAEATVAQRQATVEQYQGQLDQANLNLEYSEIRAPSDGFITMRNVQVGTYLAAGTTMFVLVSPQVWVTANFKESQLGRMRPGDRVDMKIDAYSSLNIEGHVESIQQGSGSKFSAFPAENATGNYVKIVQRVPVKIVIDRGIDPKAPPPQGLSVDPVVHVR